MVVSSIDEIFNGSGLVVGMIAIWGGLSLRGYVVFETICRIL